ncbi:hypothetical protein PRZ48_004915 [Zasmidium cellare]|uniref:Uncharacterized protein n=1 Tax=Zasmidium cellare TaxID=395010 RepID=A0ABR0ES85_ZASCE|nr:hypothetical protein PRZ48_004915 [Zasmidium cellare]
MAQHTTTGGDISRSLRPGDGEDTATPIPTAEFDAILERGGHITSLHIAAIEGRALNPPNNEEPEPVVGSAGNDPAPGGSQGSDVGGDQPAQDEGDPGEADEEDAEDDDEDDEVDDAEAARQGSRPASDRIVAAAGLAALPDTPTFRRATVDQYLHLLNFWHLGHGAWTLGLPPTGPGQPDRSRTGVVGPGKYTHVAPSPILCTNSNVLDAAAWIAIHRHIPQQ